MRKILDDIEYFKSSRWKYDSEHGFLYCINSRNMEKDYFFDVLNIERNWLKGFISFNVIDLTKIAEESDAEILASKEVYHDIKNRPIAIKNGLDLRKSKQTLRKFLTGELMNDLVDQNGPFINMDLKINQIL